MDILKLVKQNNRRYSYDPKTFKHVTIIKNYENNDESPIKIKKAGVDLYIYKNSIKRHCLRRHDDIVEIIEEGKIIELLASEKWILLEDYCDEKLLSHILLLIYNGKLYVIPRIIKTNLVPTIYRLKETFFFSADKGRKIRNIIKISKSLNSEDEKILESYLDDNLNRQFMSITLKNKEMSKDEKEEKETNQNRNKEHKKS